MSYGVSSKGLLPLKSQQINSMLPKNENKVWQVFDRRKSDDFVHGEIRLLFARGSLRCLPTPARRCQDVDPVCKRYEQLEEERRRAFKKSMKGAAKEQEDALRQIFVQKGKTVDVRCVGTDGVVRGCVWSIGGVDSQRNRDVRLFLQDNVLLGTSRGLTDDTPRFNAFKNDDICRVLHAFLEEDLKHNKWVAPLKGAQPLRTKDVTGVQSLVWTICPHGVLERANVKKSCSLSINAVALEGLPCVCLCDDSQGELEIVYARNFLYVLDRDRFNEGSSLRGRFFHESEHEQF